METLGNYLETMFSALPDTPAARQLKGEMLANMEEKFQDLTLRQGKSEAEAIGIIISEFGTIDELKAALDAQQTQQQQAPRRRRGLDFQSEDGDKVHIGLDGIHVEEAGGDTVRVDFGGVHVEKRDAGGDPVEQVYVDKHGVYVKRAGGQEEYHSHREESKTYLILSGVLVPLAIIVYLCLGLFYGMWHPYWIIIPTAALVLGSLHSLIETGKAHAVDQAIEGRPHLLRRIEGFLWPLVVLAYLYLGAFANLWHPGWAIFPICGLLDGIANTVYNVSKKEAQ